jgi:DUF4097 and DUF4098 domain-containing protein YvlB
MKSDLLAIILIAAMAAVLTSACVVDWDLGFDSGDYRYRFEDFFEADLDEFDGVKIVIVNGSITIETWDKDRIEIAVHERIKAFDEVEAEELAEEIELEGSAIGSILNIEPDYGRFYGKRRHYACNLDVRLPERLMLALETTNGKIEIELMEGDVEAESTNGSVVLEGCHGNADLSTTNGKIVAENVIGELHATTTNGGLELESKSGEVTGRTTNGSIELMVLSELEGDVRLYTTNGGIRLTIHPESSFTIEASTSSSKISDSLSGRRFKPDYNRRRTSLRGSYGDGEHRVRLSTTNGGIRIKEIGAFED